MENIGLPVVLQEQNAKANILHRVHIPPAQVQEEIPVSPGFSIFGSGSSSGSGIEWKLISTFYSTEQAQLKKETFQCSVDGCPALRYRTTIVVNGDNRMDYIMPAHQHEDEA